MLNHITNIVADAPGKTEQVIELPWKKFGYFHYALYYIKNIICRWTHYENYIFCSLLSFLQCFDVILFLVKNKPMTSLTLPDFALVDIPPAPGNSDCCTKAH